MANELVVRNNQPTVFTADVRRELAEALCFGPLPEAGARFSKILSKYGATEDQIDVLLRTPVCDIARAIEGKLKQNKIESRQPLTIGTKV